jgi:hypothetical protein
MEVLGTVYVDFSGGLGFSITRICNRVFFLLFYDGMAHGGL